MFTERRPLDAYFAHTKPVLDGVSVITVATEGQLQFDPSLLPAEPDEGNGLEVFNLDDGSKRFSRERNFQGANVDYMTATLDLDAAEVGNESVTPTTIEQQTRAMLQEDSKRGGFGGYTEYRHLYWRTGRDDRLEQKVGAVHMPRRVSPLIETVSIERYVLEEFGDMTYGFTILHNRDITDRLGMRLDDTQPVFLAFTPQLVLAKTYGPGPEVIGETTYEKLADAGIVARFSNESSRAVLDLAAGDLSFKLKLGKVLKPNYPQLLFSKREEWVTDSGVIVARMPSSNLN